MTQPEEQEVVTERDLLKERVREASYRLLESVANDLEERVAGREVDEVVEKVVDGEVVRTIEKRKQFASPQELNAAIQFLKNNGVELGPEEVGRR